jgi:hypothetical protein
VAVGHFHDPNILDLAVTTYDGHVDVLLGNGDGTFQDAVAYPVAEGHPISLVVGDLNGDTYQDLVLANPEGGTVSILYGNGDGTFQDAVNLDFHYPSAVALADLNGDHRLDLVVGDFTSTNRGVVKVFLNQGNDVDSGHANFRHSPDDDYPTGIDIRSLAVADLGNGQLDVITVSSGGQGHGLSVLLGNGDGTFERTVKFSEVGEDLGALAVADFDGDGKADVAVAANNSSRGVAVLYGKGDGTFQTPTFYDLGGKRATGVAVGDFNHDNGPDLAVTVYEGSVAVLINREGRGGPPAPPPGAFPPHARWVHNVRSAALFVLAGDRVAGTSSSVPLSRGAVQSALEVRQVDQLFAVISQQDRPVAMSRPRPSALAVQRNLRPAWTLELKAFAETASLLDSH